MNTPNKAGLYWARSKKEMQWYDLIVEVTGEAPMLYIREVYSRLHSKVFKATPDDLHFGPRVEIPEVPSKEIKA